MPMFLKVASWLRKAENRRKAGVGLVIAAIALMMGYIQIQNMLVIAFGAQEHVMVTAQEQIDGVDPICFDADGNPVEFTAPEPVEPLAVNGRQYDQEQLVNAQTIVAHVQSATQEEKASIIVLTAAIYGGGLHNTVLDGEDPQAGIFGWRTSQGWGSLEQRLDIKTAVNNFLAVNEEGTSNPGLLDIYGWQDMEPARAARAVSRVGQVSDFEKWVGDAEEIYTYVSQTMTFETCSAPPPPILGMFAYPVFHRPGETPYVTSGYGWRHHPIYGYSKLHAGTDFRAYCGTPVYASADGQVVFAGVKGGFGNHVQIRHGNNLGAQEVIGDGLDELQGFETSYSHLSSFVVHIGERVQMGDLLGFSGNTGTSTACHLHFELTIRGQTTDPLPWLG